MIFKIINLYKNIGLVEFIRFILNQLFIKFGFPLNEIHIKEKLSKYLIEKFGYQIKYGQFSGLLLNKDYWWGKYDITNKLLGSYESHVTEHLIILSKKYKYFINLGAADGYFAIGLLKKRYIDKAICFEISPKGRDNILKNSQINGVSEYIEIYGEANKHSINEIIKKNKESIILCDIEGGEFKLFNDALLSSLRFCSIIIETHEFLDNYSHDDLKKLIEISERYFDVKYINKNAIDINAYEELDDFPDDWRLLAFSENRPKKMNWLIMVPKNYETK